MKIDLHCHFSPKEYFDELRNRSVAGVGQIVGTPVPVWEGPESRLAEMDEAGIDVEVLSLTAPGVFFDDEALSTCLAQTVNDILGELCAKNPTRFLGFASVPLPHVDAAIDELHRAMTKPGMVGAVIGTNILGMPLDTEGFRTFLEEANRLGVPLMVHPAPPSAMANPEQYALGPMAGFPFETVVAALRLALSGTLDRLPGIKLIFSHLGGAIPFLYGRFDSSFGRHPKTKFGTLTAPSEHLKRLYYDTALAFWPSTFKCALDFLGPDRIVLGTDHPLALGEMAPTVKAIQSFDLPADTKEKIFSENAKSILNLPRVMLEAYG